MMFRSVVSEAAANAAARLQRNPAAAAANSPVRLAVTELRIKPAQLMPLMTIV
jgi:hypothetical protein